jgi:hypothetical protein
MTPAAPDEARVEAIAREVYSDLTGYKIFCFDRPTYADERIKAERFAKRIIAADPATARISDLEEQVRVMTSTNAANLGRIAVAINPQAFAENSRLPEHEENRLQRIAWKAAERVVATLATTDAGRADHG